MNSVTTRANRLIGQVRSLAKRRAPDPIVLPPQPVGMVEEFSPNLIKGWISTPADSAPTRVTLHLGNLEITSTYATEDRGMSGVDEDVWWFVHRPKRRNRATSIRGPREDRRNSREQIRTFSFRIAGIWPYVKPRNPITVRVDGHPLPIHGHGLYLTPPRRGARSLPELRARLAEGHVITQMGGIMLSKKLDMQWQSTVMGLYQRVREVLEAETEYQPFLVYGTLLGAVREGGYLGHDADFDAAYVSHHRGGEAATNELRDIALLLISAGLEVVAVRACLHIHDRENPAHRIDLFHLFFDDSGALKFPFGIAGTTTVTEADWRGLHEIDFPGGRALIPVNSEQLVQHIYGDDWRRPKRGFNWNVDRLDWARDGLISPSLRTEIYWANFYAAHEYTTGSTFSTFIDEHPDTPGTLIDIGCGDGRDACAFARSGRSVIGLDQSAVGIEHANGHAERMSVAATARFRVCDVADTVALGSAIDEVIAETSGPIMFYLRFFLHAIPADLQDGLMQTIAAKARTGDRFAAEFRTDKDKDNLKVHTKHYRRYQNAQEFVDALADTYGFTVRHQEERAGLSPYGEEDPILFRVIAER